MLKKLAISIFIALVLFIPINNVTAQINVKYESINPPDGISYVFKRVQEKMALFFAFSNENKVNNYKKLISVRLAELKYTVDNKKQAFFEKSTQRYFTTVGEFTSFLTSKNLESEYEPVKERLKSHIPVLLELRDKYDSGTAEWRFIEDDINYIKGYINDLSG